MQEQHHEHEKKTMWVVLLTAATMVVEIFYGLRSGSMALLADGIHMGSHVLAIGLSWLAYVMIRKTKKTAGQKLNPDKMLALSGYSSGLMLMIFAIAIMVEAIQRFFEPQIIDYQEAIYVAFIGLAVNIISAVILHHKQEQTDHNIKAAYLHVIADALTSISAIIGLFAAMVWKISSIDTIAACISSLVIVKWSLGLLKASGKELLEFNSTGHMH